MNWKLILGGGFLYYIATFLVGMITGPILHEGILVPLYVEHAQFWRPELTQVPPDMAALMPRWITLGLIGSFIIAGLYGVVRGSFAGAGWLQGIKFGLVVFLIQMTWAMGWSGVFNLPDVLWVWWTGEALLYYLVGGAVLGWFAGRFAPATAPGT